MEVLKRHWSRVPRGVRRPVIMVLGCVFILAAGLTGWLPGPGGIPLFLIGIAILATEFEWAKRVQDQVLAWLERIGHWWRAHKLVGTIIAVAGIAAGIAIGVYIARHT